MPMENLAMKNLTIIISKTNSYPYNDTEKLTEEVK